MKNVKLLVVWAGMFLASTSIGAVDCLSESLNRNQKILEQLSAHLVFLQKEPSSEVQACIEHQATLVAANCYFKDNKVLSLFRALVVPSDECLKTYSNKFKKYADDVARFSNYSRPLALASGGLTLTPKKSFLPEARSLLNRTNHLIQVMSSFKN